MKSAVIFLALVLFIASCANNTLDIKKKNEKAEAQAEKARGEGKKADVIYSKKTGKAVAVYVVDPAEEKRNKEYWKKRKEEENRKKVTTVLDKYMLSESSYYQVKDNLPSEAKILTDRETPRIDDINRIRLLETNGEGYGVKGLWKVEFWFDKNQKLSWVVLSLKEWRQDLIQYIASKYRPYKSVIYWQTLYKTNNDFIWIDKNTVTYMTGPAFSWLESHWKKIDKEIKKDEAAERAKF